MSDTFTNAAPGAAEAEAAAFAPDAKTTFKTPFEAAHFAVPEAVRSLAEKTVTESRQAYERAKDTMEEAVEVLEQSIDKAGQGAAALNRKVIDIAQANVNASFDHARELASAKNVAELFEMQTAFARAQFETLSAQAEEIRDLSTKLAADSAEPFKAQVARTMDKLKVA